MKADLEFSLHMLADPSAICTPEEVSEETRMCGRAVAEFMRRDVEPRASQLYAHDWTVQRALLRKAADLDLTRCDVQPQFGGIQTDQTCATHLSEQTAANPSFASSLSAHASLATMPVVYFGSESAQATYLPRFADAQAIGAFALTESTSGSDAFSVRSTATQSAGGGFVLNGSKLWVTNGGFADVFIVFAKANSRYLTAFIVERSGRVVSAIDEGKLGLEGTSTTAVTFNDVSVPKQNIIGEIGQGQAVAMTVLTLGRVRLGGRNVGCAKRALNAALAYSIERKQFGRQIAEFGLIKQKIADMVIRCFVAETVAYRAAGSVDLALNDAREPSRPQVIQACAAEAAISKLCTSEGLAVVVDEAVQVFGANGCSKAFPIERAYRDARLARIYEGTSEMNRLTIGAAAIDALDRVPSLMQLQWHRDLGIHYEAVERMKTFARLAFEYACTRDDCRYSENQAVLGCIVDAVVDAYALESVIARVGKMRCSQSGPMAKYAIAADVADVYAEEVKCRFVRRARAIRAAWAHLPRCDEAVRDLISSEGGVDSIGRSMTIADETVRAGLYPL